MDDNKLIRLEALRLAHEMHGANDPRPIPEIARDYACFINTGKFAGDKDAPAPAVPASDSPPATDAPAPAKGKNAR